MPYDPQKHHRRSLRLPEFDYASPGAYFVTICAFQRHCLFGQVVDGVVNLNRFGRLVETEWLRSPDIRREIELDAFVVMPNHLHGIVMDCWNRSNRSSRGEGPLAPANVQHFSRPTGPWSVSQIARGFCCRIQINGYQTNQPITSNPRPTGVAT
jgi:hypothetical protein